MAERIADIRSPELFQRLVRMLFTAERGRDFQVVDDRSGDRGNDGYDQEQRVLLAIYCPEAEPTEKRLLEKGRSDLAKAAELSRAGTYLIEEWQFITPRPLPERVQALLRGEADAAGLRSTFLSGEHLESMYLKFPHIHELFPELQYPRVGRQLQEINAKLDELGRTGGGGAEAGGASRTPDAETVPKPAASADLLTDPEEGHSPYAVDLFPGFRSDSLASLQERLIAGDTAARHELERFRLEAQSPRDRLVALMVEVQHEKEQLNYETMLRLSEEGCRIAEGLGAEAEGPVFMAWSAYARRMLLTNREIALNQRLAMMTVVGLPMVSDEEVAAYDREVPAERRSINELFRTAYSRSHASHNLAAFFTVLLLYANATTQGIFPAKIRADFVPEAETKGVIRHAREIVEKTYDLAILIARTMNAPQHLATAYLNFANDLWVFGDLQRALAHAEYALRLAVEVKDPSQQEKSQRLIAVVRRDMLATGKPE